MIASDLSPADRIPAHVAIIMDGNGRWAKRRQKPRLYGHRVGADSVRSVVEAAREIGVSYLTLYAFSSENWQRPAQEVKGLMNILGHFLKSELARMLENGIRLNAFGDYTRLPEGIRRTLLETMAKTAHHRELTLNLALNYGARDELCRAVRAIAAQCRDDGMQPESIDPETIGRYLDTAGQPDPDLLIRTGGEKRLSNFLLWQASYAELYFTDVMWPDFRKPEFIQALAHYQGRERRFGKASEQLAVHSS
jgi:undecaprenyl diphosphate synthase